MPEHHRSFLFAIGTNPKLLGDYLFIDTGIRPGIIIEAQHAYNLLRIREAFFQCDQPLFFIIHGHRDSLMSLDIRQNRIGIDTGAFFTEGYAASVPGRR